MFQNLKRTIVLPHVCQESLKAVIFEYFWEKYNLDKFNISSVIFIHLFQVSEQILLSEGSATHNTKQENSPPRLHINSCVHLNLQYVHYFNFYKHDSFNDKKHISRSMAFLKIENFMK